jgi:MFS family permease
VNAPTTPPTSRNTTAILATILVSYFVILLDNSIIFTALPKIHAAMHYSSAGLAWVQDACTLVFGGLLLLGARAGDLLGRRRVFVFGLAVFAVASLLVGLSLTGWWLIGARALQGVGAAVVAPSSLSLLTATFPEGAARAKAVALYGATAGIGASLGQVIGGALADWVSWRSGFLLKASSYWHAVALPMVLIGAVHGLAFAPLTSAGIAGVDADDAGAASGLVNTFHQVGMALGLGVLIAAADHAGDGLASATAALTAHVDTALATGSVLLALCLAVTLTLILPAERAGIAAAATTARPTLAAAAACD